MRGIASSSTRSEEPYVRLIDDARRAAGWAARRDEALARGDTEEAARCLTRHWTAVRSARRQLALAWPGLELFARRELAARWPVAHPDRIEEVLEGVRRRLSATLPVVPGLPGLYGRVRRYVRLEARSALWAVDANAER